MRLHLNQSHSGDLKWGHGVSRKSYLFTSESVSEGHPDKVCDRISDEVVDAFYRESLAAKLDPWAIRAACETLATTQPRRHRRRILATRPSR